MGRLTWHFWSLKSSKKCGQSHRSMTSSTLSRVSRFTTPGKTTYSTALRMMVRLDLEAGSRYSRVPGAQGRLVKFAGDDFLFEACVGVAGSYMQAITIIPAGSKYAHRQIEPQGSN